MSELAAILTRGEALCDDFDGARDRLLALPPDVVPEILAADNPDVWKTNRPATGGETGAMLRDIIEKAAALKLGRGETKATAARKRAPAAAPKRDTRPGAKRARKPTRRSGDST